ncbi:hypothetical protein [Candidatus Mycoplasma haematohominis]|uniref:hypothetical protein n=1 Tax=Candidatus Mycoplasma haematohominis TaxID=1494318 RepID=UPI001C0A6DE8|nr:hypothetical protein [Candidatus Mycoplasma haemohominis]
MDPLKAAAVGGGALAITGGGYGVATLLGKEPSKKHIVNKGTEGNLSYEFQHHFVDASDGKNDSWWNWSYKSRYPSDTSRLSTEFKTGVSSGSELKSKCLTAYSQVVKTSIHSDTKEANKTQYEKDIWTFCSIEGKKPFTIEEAEIEEKEFQTGQANASKLGGSKKASLISTKHKGNDKFWEIQAQAFFETGGLGSRATVDGAGFKELSTSAVTYASKKTTSELKEACKNRYAEDVETNKEKETLRFCSLQGGKQE